MRWPDQMRRALLPSALALCVAVLAHVGCRREQPVAPAAPQPALAGPEPAWPWPAAREEALRAGVTRWHDASAPDGTTLDLFRFDFGANPRLRLELWDQDEDDAAPGDGRVNGWWERGAAYAHRHLQSTQPGTVLAAWNGLFFNSTARDGKGAAHVAPVVLRGKARYNVGNHRWSVGVRYDDAGRPTFSLLHLPDRAALESAFTYGAAGAQALLREGRPLQIQPTPKAGDPPLPRPVPSSPEEAGHIPGIDHIRTARTSLGWSQDSWTFWLLIVKEPDSETNSIHQLRTGAPQSGGWDLSELQRFWQALAAWEAVNVDGGDVTQMTYRRTDGRVVLIPPRWASGENRVLLPEDLSTRIQGGTMMYFTVREAPAGRR